MHKRETSKIILIAIAIMALIVVLAWMTGTSEPDILDVPETEQAEQPVPDFKAIEDTTEKKKAFFAYLKPEVEKQNDYLKVLVLPTEMESNQNLSPIFNEKVT